MDIKKISEFILLIKKANYQAYLVGGSSRDFMYGRMFDDIDIATNAPLSFLKKNFTVVDEKGSSMGSIKVEFKKMIIDVTLFRKEEYKNDSSFPHIIEFVKDPEIDAERRDFTINAIYLDLTNNHVIDPFNGVKDLFSYVLRFIGEPKIRIKEDPTRIIRGLRLAYKMNFIIEENTNKAFIEYANELNRLSKNKIKKEIEKMVLDLGETKTKNILQQYNILGGNDYEH